MEDCYWMRPSNLNSAWTILSVRDQEREPTFVIMATAVLSQVSTSISWFWLLYLLYCKGSKKCMIVLLEKDIYIFWTGSLSVCPNGENLKLVSNKPVTCVHDADCGEAMWSCQGGHCCSRPVNTGVWLGLISADIINSDSRSRYSRRLDGQETFFIKKMFPSWKMRRT